MHDLVEKDVQDILVIGVIYVIEPVCSSWRVGSKL